MLKQTKKIIGPQNLIMKRVSPTSQLTSFKNVLRQWFLTSLFQNSRSSQLLMIASWSVLALTERVDNQFVVLFVKLGK